MSHKKYPQWTDLPYAGEHHPPSVEQGVEASAGRWKTYFIEHSRRHGFKKMDGRPIRLAIKDPEFINWQRELEEVQDTLAHLTEEQKQMAVYWGTGPASKQWIPIVDRLIDTYRVEAPRAARILGALFSGMNDAFVVCWSLKYRWLVPRPNQLDQELATVICTPKHPSYPSGHAAISGAAEAILSYFFPAERRKLHELAEENAMSRLYAGVHFRIDNNEGLRLGRQIGLIAVKQLKKDRVEGLPIDRPYTEYRNADLYPADYLQAIPFRYENRCDSLLLETDEEPSVYTEWVDPKIFL